MKAKPVPAFEMSQGHANQARRLALFDRSERLGGLGTWEWDAQAGTLLWSDNVFRIYGLLPGSVVPSAEFVLSLVHPQDAERVEAGLAHLTLGGELASLDYRVIWPNGEVRYLEATFVSTDTEGAGPLVLIGSVQDVTSRYLVDSKLKAHAAVSHAVSQWDEFESGAKGLLAALAGALDLVLGALWVPDGAALTRRTSWHSPSTALSKVDKVTKDWRPGTRSPILGRAWKSRQPVVSSRPWDGSPPERAAAIRAAGLQAVIALPAVTVGDTKAVLEFLSCDPIEPNDQLLGMLTGIGHEVGYFLARRHGDLAKRVLTPRQLQVLQLAAREYSAADIAKELFLSPATIKRHFGRAYAQLGVTDRAGAIAKAMREGLID
jgi:DNA-binding CsgD family transcriptional regulator